MLDFERHQVLSLHKGEREHRRRFWETYNPRNGDPLMGVDDFEIDRRLQSSPASDACLNEVAITQKSQNGEHPETYPTNVDLRKPFIQNRESLEIAIHRHRFLDPLFPREHSEIVAAKDGYEL